MRPFCIIGTPRSRTAWLAAFLSHGAVRCEHEPSKMWGSDADIGVYFRPGTGASDSMLTLKWRALRAANVNLIAVVRPADDVLRSAKGAGLPDGSAMLARISAAIDELPNDIPQYSFSDLDHTAAQIFECCHGHPCSPAWLAFWRREHIEADFSEALRVTLANADGFARFYDLRGF